MYVTEVVAETLQLMESKDVSSSVRMNPTKQLKNKPTPPPLPKQETDPFAQSSSAIDVSNDDLPFNYTKANDCRNKNSKSANVGNVGTERLKIKGALIGFLTSYNQHSFSLLFW